MEGLSVLMVSWWVLWKTAMLLEILANHAYYRSALAKRRSSATPTFGYHLCDSVYAYSYSVLGFQLGWQALQLSAHFVYQATPYSWSAIGILLMLGLRAAVASFGQGVKAVMHWSMHRMLHVQPFYTCWHKEHHFAASQTCLTACQDCGLLESGAEAAYVNLCFVFVPFFDNCAFMWRSLYNTLIHHYYEEYRNWHWKLAGQMILAQKRVNQIVSFVAWGSSLCKLMPFIQIWPSFAKNLQYPSADYASAHFADGSIEKHWHGRHHWTTEKHFGYGTYDSISNLASDSSQENQEEQMVLDLQNTYSQEEKEKSTSHRGQSAVMVSTDSRIDAWEKALSSDEPHGLMSGFLISVGCACAVLWALEMCEISFAQSRFAGPMVCGDAGNQSNADHPTWDACRRGSGSKTQVQMILGGIGFLQAMAYIGFILALFLPADAAVWFLLIFFRSLGGFFGGFANLAASWLAFEMTPPEELMNLQTSNQACFGMGHCMGGVMSSLALVFFHLNGMEQSSAKVRQAGAAPAMLFVAVNVLLLAMIVLLVPRRSPERAIETTALPAAEGDKAKAPAGLALILDDSDRNLVFRTGVIYNFERSFSVGAIEVATTMISEVEFGFSPVTTGWIFGFIALGSAVANILVSFTPANIDSRVLGGSWAHIQVTSN
ncbi:unnamed protein product [Symbiodinium pilosum]|uniref:Uncharacterized protein n=1 Tax=Symbiodinium pilosum TaxID=2952 RepID=A0A812P7W7_SYMPI|nr:unnamed protein product [Symbiodinium pilosum]